MHIAQGMYNDILNNSSRSYNSLFFESWGSNHPHLTYWNMGFQVLNKVSFLNIIFDANVGFWTQYSGAIYVDSCEFLNIPRFSESTSCYLTHSLLQKGLMVNEECWFYGKNNFIRGKVDIKGYQGEANLFNNVILGPVHIYDLSDYDWYRVKVFNNIICSENSPDTGIVHDNFIAGNDKIAYNDVFGFSTFTHGFDTTGLNLLNSDPLFSDSLYHLYANSPCIDAGDPAPSFNDVDGTRNDIGAYGGPGGESYSHPPSNAQFQQNVLTDWNLLGLPLDITDTYYMDVYPNAIPGTCFGWNSTYINVDSLETGLGFWLRFPATETNLIEGYSLSNLAINLIADWNIISGGIGCSLALSEINDPGGILIPGTLFGFSNTYYPSDSIKQGEGYWVRTSSPGQIVFDCTAQSSTLSKNYFTLPDLSDYPALNIADATGTDQTLHFNVELENPEQKLSYSLPPLPPAGAFDVRFAGDYRIAESNEAIINLQSSAYPVSISADNLPVEKHYQYVLTESGTDKVHVLKAGEAVQITSPAVTSLRLSREEMIPLEFAVHQNYPNPFNPETVIDFALPENSHVYIEVYNILGQRVRSLINEKREAGYHSVSWDGTNDIGQKTASGVYIYRVVAGNNLSIKKMLLLR
ncbi:MAG: FlgD immunoglobulin-like domain containing protein [Calditrichia bacterium]